MAENTVIFTTDDNEEIEFQIIEQTTLNGISYILVTDTDVEDEGNAYILKTEESDEEVEEFVYRFVEEEEELELIGKIFAELLEDIDLQ